MADTYHAAAHRAEAAARRDWALAYPTDGPLVVVEKAFCYFFAADYALCLAFLPHNKRWAHATSPAGLVDFFTSWPMLLPLAQPAARGEITVLGFINAMRSLRISKLRRLETHFRSAVKKQIFSITVVMGTLLFVSTAFILWAETPNWEHDFHPGGRVNDVAASTDAMLDAYPRSSLLVHQAASPARLELARLRDEAHHAPPVSREISSCGALFSDRNALHCHGYATAIWTGFSFLLLSALCGSLMTGCAGTRCCT